MILDAELCGRAVDARDPRFDGLFFVGLTSTGIYCRPICPSRAADPRRRRYFPSAAAAERARFRPCLRCRPELAPGRARVDAVSRLASAAADRIAAGALNERSVAKLAAELFVSERHLRRAVRRELGVSPVQLAQTHRLLLARQLLNETSLDMTAVAFASGFRSLRRFNAAMRERYGMSPTEVRRAARRRVRAGNGVAAVTDADGGSFALTLSYRPPFAWDVLLARLRRDAIPRVERVGPRRYARALRIDGAAGHVVAEDVPERGHLRIEVSASLLAVLRPLLARLRRLFDLDADPRVVDAHLEEGGLGGSVRDFPGVRVPGAVDGFQIAVSEVLLHGRRSEGRRNAVRVVREFGDRIDTGLRGVDRLPPPPQRIIDAGAAELAGLGVPAAVARSLVALARCVLSGDLRLEPGGDVGQTRRVLIHCCGMGPAVATAIVARALHWPDAFSASNRVLQRAAGVEDAVALHVLAERWRPWRAYAACHLALERARFTGTD